MGESFEIYVFKFIDKDTKTKADIYARSEEFALKIIQEWNDMQDIYHWSIPRFGFKKKACTSIPPYELELEQLDTINSWKQRIKANMKNQ